MSRAFLLFGPPPASRNRISAPPPPSFCLRRIVPISLSVPHTYTIVGGGEWGPRVVAKALLESVYVDWVNDVYLLDMEEAKAYMRPENEFEKVFYSSV